MVKGQDKRAEIEFQSRVAEQGERPDHLDPLRREKELRLMGILSARSKLILDAGCGQGTYGLILARKGNTVVGVDIMGAMVKFAKYWADKENLSYFPLIADVESLPFRNESFDICFCGSIIHHFPNMGPVVAEIYRLLKPGGTIALIEPNGSSPVIRTGRAFSSLFSRWLRNTRYTTSPNERRMHSHKQYIKMLQANGFGDISVKSQLVTRVKPGSKKRLPRTSLEMMLDILFILRMALAYLAVRFLPQPYGGLELHIRAIKGKCRT